jgi:DNA-directed RNA polymerase subunit RPC12/RpoP
MWRCIRCMENIPDIDVNSGIDRFGIYFICPRCGRRNQLINVGKGGRSKLAQTTD